LRKIARWVNNELLRRLGVRVVTTDHQRYTKTYGSLLLYFEKLMDQVNDVDGVVVECGVSTGASMTLFATLNANRDAPRDIWGFDSFEGLPAPDGEDLTGSAAAGRRGMFKATTGDVWNRLRIAGMGDDSTKDRITLVQGLLSDTLPSFKGQIALLHCDVDLYEPTKIALEYLWPQVGVGGIAAFDEYDDDEWPGEKQAVDEYFADALEDGSVEFRYDRWAKRTYAVKLK
jgi:hypothetical protein